jgi:hypothetical protein
VVEGELREPRRTRDVAARHEVVPRDGARHRARVASGLRPVVGNHDDFDGRQPRHDARRPPEAVGPRALPERAARADEHLGLDLAEAVEHALRAEVG